MSAGGGGGVGATITSPRDGLGPVGGGSDVAGGSVAAGTGSTMLGTAPTGEARCCVRRPEPVGRRVRARQPTRVGSGRIS